MVCLSKLTALGPISLGNDFIFSKEFNNSLALGFFIAPLMDFYGLMREFGKGVVVCNQMGDVSVSVSFDEARRSAATDRIEISHRVKSGDYRFVRKSI